MEATVQSFVLSDEELADLQSLYERVNSSASDLRAAVVE